MKIKTVRDSVSTEVFNNNPNIFNLSGLDRFDNFFLLQLDLFNHLLASYLRFNL